MQDLVDVRAELVKAVLAHAECGFTLFGDPAQGIYNFQLEDRAARAIGSLALFQWLRDNFDDLERHTLDHNFRAQTDEARTALFAGAALNARTPDYEDIRYRLESAMLGLPSFPDLAGAAPFLRSQEPGSTAVLVRTNGQALLVSRELFALERAAPAAARGDRPRGRALGCDCAVGRADDDDREEPGTRNTRRTRRARRSDTRRRRGPCSSGSTDDRRLTSTSRECGIG